MTKSSLLALALLSTLAACGDDENIDIIIVADGAAIRVADGGAGPDVRSFVDAAPGSDATPGSATFSEQCTSNSDCREGVCLSGTSFPGGFCSRSCTAGDDGTCDDPNLICVGVGAVPSCLKSCIGDTDCTRDGYGCVSIGGRMACAGK